MYHNQCGRISKCILGQLRGSQWNLHERGYPWIGKGYKVETWQNDGHYLWLSVYIVAYLCICCLSVHEI